jgi:uncharacterized protein YjbI with pentapeptide repeats
MSVINKFLDDFFSYVIKGHMNQNRNTTYLLLSIALLFFSCEKKPISEKKIVYKNYQFEKADFQNQKLSEANFSGAHLNLANFSNAEIDKAIFVKADLTGANLSHVHAEHANFKEANLTNADLSFGNFEYAYFEKATLIGVVAKEAQFKNSKGLSDETRANLEKAGARFD